MSSGISRPPHWRKHYLKDCVEILRHDEDSPSRRVLETQRNLVPVDRNSQINSALMIGAHGGVDVEHIKRNHALLAVNTKGQNACRQQKATSLHSLSVFQNKYRRRQYFCLSRICGTRNLSRNLNDQRLCRRGFWFPRRPFVRSQNYEWRCCPLSPRFSVRLRVVKWLVVREKPGTETVVLPMRTA
jgi:hypothetical protein